MQRTLLPLLITAEVCKKRRMNEQERERERERRGRGEENEGRERVCVSRIGTTNQKVEAARYSGGVARLNRQTYPCQQRTPAINTYLQHCNSPVTLQTKDRRRRALHIRALLRQD
ncbi:hypothetical protein J6590_054776 [Homalodisca vitripennis]|nr:hypothetical protein J6590_054776 [Homalodisca vitripennis]